MKLTTKKILYLTPVVFWLFQLIVHIIRNIHVIIDRSFNAILNPVIVTYPLDMLTFCVFYFFLAPKYFKKEKTGLYIVLGIIYFILHSALWTFVYYSRSAAPESFDYLAIYFSSMGHNLLYAFYGIVFRLAIDWFQKREDKRDLEKQNVKTELALLRSQINPHFLFNTLNNIHSFSLKDHEKSSAAIIKLSDIMRYMLYEAKDESVLLEKEVNYIRNYLDLQRMRYKEAGFIDFRVGPVPSGLFVPPMLFMPFIENAFKHGRKDGENRIEIYLDFSDNEIQFSCKNRKRSLNDTEQNGPKGIGIENIKRRLELIFPEKHKLAIRDEEDDYIVNLSISIL